MDDMLKTEFMKMERYLGGLRRIRRTMYTSLMI